MSPQDVTELPPLTQEQRNAIRACRFAYTTQSRDHAWLLYDDTDLFDKHIKTLDKVVRRTDSYTRDHVTKVTEHEVLVGHPEAVAFVLEMIREREQ